jgi:hypothetical protein
MWSRKEELELLYDGRSDFAANQRSAILIPRSSVNRVAQK